jgi:hypothetical protein
MIKMRFLHFHRRRFLFGDDTPPHQSALDAELELRVPNGRNDVAGKAKAKTSARNSRDRTNHATDRTQHVPRISDAENGFPAPDAVHVAIVDVTVGRVHFLRPLQMQVHSG